MKLHIYLIFTLPLFLNACKEGNTKPKEAPQEQSQKMDVDLHQFKVPEPEKEVEARQEAIEEPEINLSDIHVPSTQPLAREQRARALRGERQYQASKHLSKDVRYINKIENTHKDYSSLGIGVDESTYPVDRSRMLTSEMRISAVLEDTINSQIPGRAIAVIDRDVLSSDGKNILFPSYTKIICNYKSLSRKGNTRLSLKCTRIIRPDGLSLMLTSAQAADQMGRNGLVGDVDHRLWQKYGGAFLVSGISALAQAGSGMTRSRAVDEGVTNLSQNLAQVTAQFLEEAIDIKPVITIPAGSRIQIIPQTDILIRKPQVKKIRRKR